MGRGKCSLVSRFAADRTGRSFLSSCLLSFLAWYCCHARRVRFFRKSADGCFLFEKEKGKREKEKGKSTRGQLEKPPARVRSACERTVEGGEEEEEGVEKRTGRGRGSGRQKG